MIVEAVHKIYSFSARKKFAKTRGLGSGSFGYGELGDDNEFGGVWQRKYTKKGPKWSLMVYARPPVSRTTKQDVCRTKFANGRAAWRALTSDQKQFYNRQVKGRVMSGYNLFMKHFIIGR